MSVSQSKALKQLKALKKNSSYMRLAAESWDGDWKILVATILSARTRDEMTIPIATELFSKYKSIDKLSRAKITDIEKIIRPINFYKNKAKNVLNCAKTLVKEYEGKVPKKIEYLVKLPGVGRKTANVFLSENGQSAIGVDTHVSYISRKLGWTKYEDAEKIERDIQELFPKRYWKKINPVLVRFGKTHTSRKRKDSILAEIRKI